MLTLRGVGYRYPSSVDWAVEGIDLDVRAGEVVVLTGPTGCGKSTVLRMAAGLLRRHGSGESAGAITVGGRDPAALSPRERVGLVGFVAQNPGRQIITGTLGDEVAFGLDSAGWPEERSTPRVRELLDRVGLDYPLDRSTSALSGGERQRLMVAAAMAAGAGLLVLDEPLAHLDPQGAATLMTTLRALADEGAAVLLVEHRLEQVWPACDRAVVLDEGRRVGGGALADVPVDLLRRLGLRVPGLMDLEDRLTRRGAWPVSVSRPVGEGAVEPAGGETPALAGGAWVSASHVDWTWPGAEAAAVSGVTCGVHDGERIAILGPNGSGKSTLMALLAGALKTPGVERRGRVVRVPQDPDLALFCETVREEIEYGPRENRLSRTDVGRAAGEAADALSVSDLLDRAPHALSRGQRLRVAAAAAWSCSPDVLFLDEPTSGQDHDQVERLMRAFASRGLTLVFATHDVDLALRQATRIWRLEAGALRFDGAPSDPGAVHGLMLPPLVQWCLDHGLPPMTAAAADAALAGEG